MCCNRLHMSGDIYFLMTRDHSILGSFNNLSDARTKLHAMAAAQYVARVDGVVLAFMSRDGQSWRVISKVPPEVRKAFYVHANINPDQEQEPDEAEELPLHALYPPAETSIEVAFDL